MIHQRLVVARFNGRPLLLKKHKSIRNSLILCNKTSCLKMLWTNTPGKTNQPNLRVVILNCFLHRTSGFVKSTNFQWLLNASKTWFICINTWKWWWVSVSNFHREIDGWNAIIIILCHHIDPLKETYASANGSQKPYSFPLEIMVAKWWICIIWFTTLQ